MKIIAVDNFNRESVSDHLVCENVNKYYGEKIVNFLNQGGEYAQTFYRLVEDDHKLYVFEL